MSTAVKVFGHRVRDLSRSRSVAGYGIFMALATWGLLHFGGGPERALPSLATLILLVVPLVSVLITTSLVYQGEDFVELLLSHPVGRTPLFTGMYLALALPLAGAVAAGILIPFAVAGGLASHAADVGIVVLAGVLLGTAFTSIGFLVALRVDDAARGMGIALLIWLSLAVLYDGAVLLAAYRWAAYPLETPMLVLMGLNPVDLARVLVITALDASAMMGYTGAVFQDFFGGAAGLTLSLTCLSAWTVAPALAALHTFRRKDF
jgi:Cu-processing system permease protein